MTLDFIIAGRRIRLRSGDGVTLNPDERFSAFLTAVDGEPELTVDVFPGRAVVPADARKVFDASLMEETPQGVRDSGEPFWEVLSDGQAVYARAFLKAPARNPVLVIPHNQMTWRLYADSGVESVDSPPLPPAPCFSLQSSVLSLQSLPTADRVLPTGPLPPAPGFSLQSSDFSLQSLPTADSGLPTGPMPPAPCPVPHAPPPLAVDPLPWPVDGLLLYFLSAVKGDVMIHGSAVSCGGRGWLFTGRSGSGKTTIAGIFDRAGDRVIHDDRLIIRKESSGWIMHSTPVYRNDEPRSAPLDHLWIIRHGRSNVSEPVTGAAAVAMVLSNCIQQNWNRERAEMLAATVDDMVASVRVSRLAFVPAGTIRDYLIARESDSKIMAAEAATAILNEEIPVTITTGGYSMWPVIRPGDRVVIDPLKGINPSAGDIVALRRDGGYVVHRVYEVITRDGRQLFCTQGDAVISPDEPSEATMIAGMVRSIVRSGKEISLPAARRFPPVINKIASLFARYILTVR